MTPGVAVPLCDITEDWEVTAVVDVVVVRDGRSGDPGYLMGPLNQAHRTEPKSFSITFFFCFLGDHC